jgi:hypothetical protein
LIIGIHQNINPEFKNILDNSVFAVYHAVFINKKGHLVLKDLYCPKINEETKKNERNGKSKL